MGRRSPKPTARPSARSAKRCARRFRITVGTNTCAGGIAPTFVTYSGDGDSNSEFGGTVVVGVQVPLIKNKATNIEGRFGFAGVPDIRLLLSLIL